MGEVENIGPGLTRTFHVELAEPGTYETACKPGMVGDGIRGAFTVTGDVRSRPQTTTRTSRRRPPTTSATSRARPTRCLARTTEFVGLVKAGEVDEAKALYPVARSYWERIEPVAESFGDLDPRIDGREDVVEEGMEFTGYHRLEKDLWETGLQPDSGAIADQLLADVTEIVGQGQGRRAQPAPAGQRLQGPARRDRHRQDHRRGGALQPHRPLGLRGEPRGLARRPSQALRPFLEDQRRRAGRDDRRPRSPRSTGLLDDAPGRRRLRAPTPTSPTTDVQALTEALDAFAEPVATVAGVVANG